VRTIADDDVHGEFLEPFDDLHERGAGELVAHRRESHEIGESDRLWDAVRLAVFVGVVAGGVPAAGDEQVTSPHVDEERLQHLESLADRLARLADLDDARDVGQAPDGTAVLHPGAVAPAMGAQTWRLSQVGQAAIRRAVRNR
jgi:hypothetical protein